MHRKQTKKWGLFQKMEYQLQWAFTKQKWAFQEMPSKEQEEKHTRWNAQLITL